MTASRGRRRTQLERSNETRTRVIEAASVCIAEEGFGATNLARIAERAGMTTGAIQHQFGDKAGVLTAVVERSLEELAAEVAALPADGSSLRRRVARFVEAIWLRYSLPRSRAALETLIHMRTDPDFAGSSLPHLARVRDVIDRMWMGTFSDAKAPRARHVRAQRLLFTTLNGLAVEGMLLPGEPDARADLTLLTDGILRILRPNDST